MTQYSRNNLSVFTFLAGIACIIFGLPILAACLIIISIAVGLGTSNKDVQAGMFKELQDITDKLDKQNERIKEMDVLKRIAKVNKARYVTHITNKKINLNK